MSCVSGMQRNNDMQANITMKSGRDEAAPEQNNPPGGGFGILNVIVTLAPLFREGVSH
jgi:hypothetical protein